MHEESREKLIDLRSDTVTRPTPAMREAMARAEVGDDVFGDDSTVNALEERAAEIFGREAALYVPSGTMGNLVCLMSQAAPGDEAVVEAKSHVYNAEMGGLSALGGLVPRVVPGENGILDAEAVAAAITTGPKFRAHTALLCLENTHNRAGGSVYPPERVSELCNLAHEKGIRVHLDGARIFNASVALGRPVDELTAEVDSLSFCFSKGLGAPVGSMAVGSGELIDKARRIRKTLGGGMRQAGVIAAAARVALEESPKRLHEDHERAARLARSIEAMPGLRIDAASVKTNIVIYDVAGTGLDSAAFLKRLREEGVMALAVGASEVRMVTHQDIDDADLDAAIAALERMTEGVPLAS